MPDYIFWHGLVGRESGGWRITDKGRALLAFMEARPGADQAVETPFAEKVVAPVPPLPQLAERARRRRERCERRWEARERARANAS